MRGCIFLLGKIDKRIIWPFLFAIIQVAMHFINKIFPPHKVNQIIDSFSISLGDMLVLIILLYLKAKIKL